MKRLIGIAFLFIHMPIFSICQNNSDTLSGWYLYSLERNPEKVNLFTQAWHFATEGYYEMYGCQTFVSDRIMEKGSWRKAGDTIVIEVMSVFFEKPSMRSFNYVGELIPHEDRYLIRGDSVICLDTGISDFSFRLYRLDLFSNSKDAVSQNGKRILNMYDGSLLRADTITSETIAGYYSWKGFSSSETLRLNTNGKFVLRDERGLYRKEKGRWELQGDSLRLIIKHRRTYCSSEENIQYERFLEVHPHYLSESKNPVTGDYACNLYRVEKDIYLKLCRFFKKSIHGK